ncbi:MAG: hypothetical protein LBF59_10400 [Prevotellaceae bacterium]|jgi:hypothetical protein|nr:hypothetical protein [Prevotellaceae bacterium]
MTCLNCGYKFKAGEALILGNNIIENQFKNELDNELKEIVEKKGKMQAISFYKEKNRAGLREASEYVDDFIKKNNLTPDKGGCAGMIILFVALTSIAAGIF